MILALAFRISASGTINDFKLGSLTMEKINKS
jgi:hypothetical protein